MDPSNTPIVPSGTAGGRLDPDSLVAVELEHLGLIQINDPSQFTIRVAGGDDAELAVSVQGLSILNISSFYMSLLAYLAMLHTLYCAISTTYYNRFYSCTMYMQKGNFAAKYCFHYSSSK